MTTPVVPPPPPPPEKGWFQRFSVGTFVFIIFMLLVGSGIFLTKVTNFSLASSPSPTVLANRLPTASATTTLRPTSTPLPIPTATVDPSIKVYITGEVQKPGVYEMMPGDRINDVIKLAGGETEFADLSQLELALRVQDEMHIVIPSRPPTPDASATSSEATLTPHTTTTTSPAGGITVPVRRTVAPSGSQKQPAPAPVRPTVAPAPARTTVAPAPAKPAGKVNLNTSNQADLESLPGIGPVLAQRIIEYRTKNGPFKTLNDVVKVQGVSKNTVEKFKDLVEL